MAKRSFGQGYEKKSHEAGYSLVEMMVAVGLTSVVALGAFKFYQTVTAQSQRKALISSVTEEQRLISELIKSTWDTKNINNACTGRRAKKLASGCISDSWNNQADFGFQIGGINPSTQITNWVPRLQINYRIWTNDSTSVQRTMTIETKCKAAPPGVLAKIPNLTISPQDCSPCSSTQVPYVQVQDGTGKTSFFPAHLQDVTRMSLQKSLGMRICFKFQGNPNGYDPTGAIPTQDPQLQLTLQSLLVNAAGKSPVSEVKAISFPMLRPSTLKIERRVKQ